MSSSEDNHHREADYQHRQSEQLASRERSQIEADMCVGLSNELHQKSKHSIESNQSPRYRSWVEVLPEQPLDN
jgi:mevalonate pyrophosphate decarboxylase